MEEPKLIKGGLSVDNRGFVEFINDFKFEGIKRFYALSNHANGFVRAWHGHKKESKYFYAVNGTALVCAVKIDSWENPSANIEVQKYILSDKTPEVLYIPAGYANGFMSLTNECKIIVFSTATLDESLKDDFRFPARHWDPWHVDER